MYSYIFLTKLISNNMYNVQFTTLSKSCTCNRQILLQKIHYYCTCVQNERKSQQTHIPSALPLLDATHDEQQGIKGIYLIYFTFFPSISIWFILTEIFGFATVNSIGNFATCCADMKCFSYQSDIETLKNFMDSYKNYVMIILMI